MPVECIRLKLSAPNLDPIYLNGGFVINEDGTTDFFGDCAAHAELIIKVLNAIDASAPLKWVVPEDLLPEHTLFASVRADTVRVADQRVVGPILFRPGAPVAVGGDVLDDIATLLARVLVAHAASAKPRDRRVAA